MKKISVLITVFNRKEKTLFCLKQLVQSFDFFNQNGEYKLEVFLTDDGSTDGTAEAVKTKYPEVLVIQGDGNLFWNRGMIHSWEVAAKTNPDFYLWLNDDTHLNKEAFVTLFKDYSSLNDKNAILVGATNSKENGALTYSAEKNYVKLKPTNQLQLCDTFNGNFVFIPDSVYNKIGMLDPYYSHSLGDFAYGWKATRAHVKSYLLTDYIGYCEPNIGIKACFDINIPFRKRLKNLYSPLGCNPKEFFHFDYNYFGLFQAIKHFVSIHLKAIFPKS